MKTSGEGGGKRGRVLSDSQGALHGELSVLQIRAKEELHQCDIITTRKTTNQCVRLQTWWRWEESGGSSVCLFGCI